MIGFMLRPMSQSSAQTSKPRWRTALVQGGAVAVLLLLASPFVLHAWRLGLRGLTEDLSGVSRAFEPEAWLSTPAIYAHMAGGAVVTALAPLQLLPSLRRRAPALHRWSGRLIAALAAVTAICGLAFIALRGTIGGPAMDAGFGLYGVLMLLAAAGTVRHALARDFVRHQEWALRLFVLAIGSWLYRLHYGLWHLATGGAASAPDFSGAFDRVQLVAFYAPYLLALEAWFALRRRRARL
jgi:hypothetical protein